MPTDTLNIPALAAEFTAAHPRLDAPEQRLALALFRLLGEGERVGPEDLAERSGLPAEEVASRLEAWPMVHRDEQGRVFAFGGLSLEPTSHVLEVDGHRLYAWCALDTLFLPELLGRPARIRSTCPQTGDPISLTVDAAGVRDVEPERAVMSLHEASALDLQDVVANVLLLRPLLRLRRSRARLDGAPQGHLHRLDRRRVRVRAPLQPRPVRCSARGEWRMTRVRLVRNPTRSLADPPTRSL